MPIRTLLSKLKLTSSQQNPTFQKAPHPKELFPPTKPEIDGVECLHDCEGCSVRLPAKWSIDETEKIYGHVNSFHRHLIVATERSDWIRDVTGIKGSVMQAVGKHEGDVNNGKLMLSASNMPIPHTDSTEEEEPPTRCILLPAFITIDNVTPSNVPLLITQVINPTSTNMSPLSSPLSSPLVPELPSDSPFKLSNCPHDYLILLCSHRTRDARCGQSAPLLRKEFERHLRPLGLMRDLHDERPGGVGIYFINHVGGHKFSANVMVYRRAGFVGSEEVVEKGDSKIDEVSGETNGAGEVEETVESVNGSNGVAGTDSPKGSGEAAQCIWLARVRPEDCENIIRYTVLQGKVVKPDNQLRGGFDRCKQLASW